MENFEIKELPYATEDANNFYRNSIDIEEPLLEYVEAWAEEFCPSFEDGYTTDPETGEEKMDWFRIPSRLPAQFVARLLRKEIMTAERCKERYEEAKELHKTLDAYDIEKSRFYYLCLMLKDYINGYDNAHEQLPTHSQVLKELIDKLDKMEPDEKMWEHGSAKHTAEITLKVEGEKGVFRTNDTAVLNIINYCLTRFYYKHCAIEGSIFNSASLFGGRTLGISNTEKAFLFNKYLKWFLKGKKYKKASGADRGADLLISRSLYIFELLGKTDEIDRDNYYESTRMDNKGERTYNKYLRDLIKKTKDPSQKLHNEIYWLV